MSEAANAPIMSYCFPSGFPTKCIEIASRSAPNVEKEFYYSDLGLEIIPIVLANTMLCIATTRYPRFWAFSALIWVSHERLTGRSGEERAAKVLKTLVAAKRAPVAIIHGILAVAAVLYAPTFGWQHLVFDRHSHPE
jgi:hypothetical protein